MSASRLHPLARKTLSGALGISLSGAALAFASSIGGLGVQTLGAANATVDSCSSGAAIHWQDAGYQAPGPNYGSIALTVDQLERGCNGHAIQVTVTDSRGDSLAQVKGKVTNGSFTGALPKSVNLEQVHDVGVVVFK